MTADILPKLLPCKDHCPLLDRLSYDPAAVVAAAAAAVAAAGDAGDEVKEGDFNVQTSMRNKQKI
jgi:hypothetical protein